MNDHIVVIIAIIAVNNLYSWK